MSQQFVFFGKEEVDALRQSLTEIKEALQSLQVEKQPLKWLSTKQVMEVLSVSKSTLEKMRYQGIIPYSKRARKIYYLSTDIDNYLQTSYYKSIK